MKNLIYGLLVYVFFGTAAAAPADDISYLNRCMRDSERFATREGGCKDLATGHIWSRSLSAATYSAANQFCRTLTVGPYNDWELPWIRSVANLVLDRVALNHLRFRPDFYWTQSHGAGDGMAAVIMPLSGEEDARASTDVLPFVCIRQGVVPGQGCIVEDDYFRTIGGGCGALHIGVVWSSGSPLPMRRRAAATYCAALQEGGKSDWRIPTIDEMQEVAAPHLGRTHLRNLRQNELYWANGWGFGGDTSALLTFNDPTIIALDRTYNDSELDAPHHAICVRKN